VTTGSEVAHLESCIEIILHAFPWSNDTHAQPRKSRVVRTEGQHVIPERSRTGNQPEPLSTQFAAMIASGSRCSTRGGESGRHAAEQDGWWRGCKPERPEGQSGRLKDFVRQPRRWAAKPSIASAVTFISYPDVALSCRCSWFATPAVANCVRLQLCITLRCDWIVGHRSPWVAQASLRASESV
jgi:hypothetical protein